MDRRHGRANETPEEVVILNVLTQRRGHEVGHTLQRIGVFQFICFVERAVRTGQIFIVGLVS